MENVKEKYKAKKSKKKDQLKAMSNIPFTLSKKDLEITNDRAELIQYPVGFGLKTGRVFSNTGSLKSHDWIQLVTQGVLKFCLRDLLGETQRKTLFRFLDCLTLLCAESQNLRKLDAIEEEVNICIALMERDFPLCIHNITTHLLHHITDGIVKFGPVYSTWMFVFERFNSWLCQRALNKRSPEATIIETYIIYDWCQFMFATGRLPNHQAPSEPEGIDDTDRHESSQVKLTRSHDVKLTARDLRELAKIYKQDKDNAYCANEIVPHAVKYYRHCEQNQNTNRSSVYTSRKGYKTHFKTASHTVELKSDHCSSESGCTKKIGIIEYFLEHRQGPTQMLSLAKVSWYTDIQFVPECKLWNVDKKTSTMSKSYVLVRQLSRPLVTALEGDVLWFLNCKNKGL